MGILNEFSLKFAVYYFALGYTLLLIPSAISRLKNPDITIKAVSHFGINLNKSYVYMLSYVELIVALLFILINSSLFYIICSILYLCFTIFTLVLIHKNAPSCGCFGATDFKPSYGHVVTNSVGAIIFVCGVFYPVNSFYLISSPVIFVIGTLVSTIIGISIYSFMGPVQRIKFRRTLT
jgi:hypothetical protein